MKAQTETKHHYETPFALRHDARTLAEDAQALIDATAEIVDEKVFAARGKLAEAIETIGKVQSDLQTKAVRSAKAADMAVHEHPYQAALVAFGLGAVVGFLFHRHG
jgi:ElaB/YqjD/DUF883 family membrane-anchored ribosome-binding protein